MPNTRKAQTFSPIFLYSRWKLLKDANQRAPFMHFITALELEVNRYQDVGLSLLFYRHLH